MNEENPFFDEGTTEKRITEECPECEGECVPDYSYEFMNDKESKSMPWICMKCGTPHGGEL